MDFKLKSKSWAGSIYHQFESICHDVDGFVTKDTVEYMENQVQSVGESVKRLYSSVKDMLPPLEDQVKPEAIQVQDESIVNAATDLTLKPINVGEKKLSLDDTLEKAMTSLTFDDNKSQPIEPACVDPCREAKTHVVRADYDHTVMNEEGHGIENSSSDATMATLTSEKERISFNNFTDYADCFSDVCTSGWSFEDNLLTFEDSKTGEDEIQSFPPILLSDENHQDKSSVMDPPVSSDFDGTDRVLKEDISLSDNKEVSSDHMATNRSTSPKSSNIIESSSANYTQDHSIQSSSAKRDDFTNSSFTSASATLHDETKAIDLHPIASIEGSNDYYSAERTDHISSDCDDVMETIDLSSDAKPDRPTIVSGSKFNHSASYRKRNFRYYKKLIQNALASRKRLSKEYEHLPILYGDIDTELHQHFEPHSLPFSLSQLSSSQTQENEWELL